MYKAWYHGIVYFGFLMHAFEKTGEREGKAITFGIEDRIGI